MFEGSKVTLSLSLSPQQSSSRVRAWAVKDDEEGHLIYRPGDVLQDRCASPITSYSTFTVCSVCFLWRLCFLCRWDRGDARRGNLRESGGVYRSSQVSHTHTHTASFSADCHRCFIMCVCATGGALTSLWRSLRTWRNTKKQLVWRSTFWRKSTRKIQKTRSKCH